MSFKSKADGEGVTIPSPRLALSKLKGDHINLSPNLCDAFRRRPEAVRGFARRKSPNRLLVLLGLRAFVRCVTRTRLLTLFEILKPSPECAVSEQDVGIALLFM